MTKSIRTIIAVIIILFLAYLAYSVYFTSMEGMESFNDFDINSTASKNIRVELIREKGITQNEGGGTTFYVKDKKGIEMKVVIGKELHPQIINSQEITLTGHSHGDYFHASDATTD